MDSHSWIEDRLGSPWCPVSREAILQVLKLDLRAPAFQLYVVLRFCASDDKNNKHTGQVKITQREFAKFLKWHTTKVNTYWQELGNKRLVSYPNRGTWLISLDGNPLYSDKPGHNVPQSENNGVPIKENKPALEQGNHIRDKRGREEDVLRTDHEYQRIQKEHGFTELTIDDMKWIDQNIREEPGFYGKTSEQLTNGELLQIFPGATIEEVRNGERKTA